MFYTSQAFHGAKAKYLRVEKIAFALVIASRKLHLYFQAHPIIVMIDQPIRKTMNKIDIEYKPQVAIKAQVLADFIVGSLMHKTKKILPRNDSNRWIFHQEGQGSGGCSHINRERNHEVCS